MNVPISSLYTVRKPKGEVTPTFDGKNYPKIVVKKMRNGKRLIIDGVARYYALKKLGVQTVKVKEVNYEEGS